jgi:hypothetical protein
MPVVMPVVETLQPIVQTMSDFQNTIDISMTETAATWSIWTVLQGAYTLIIILFLVKMGLGLFKIFRLYKDGFKEAIDDFSLVNTEGVSSPFSFFKWIFVNKKTIQNIDFQNIITHELAHVKQGHSYDILSLEILRGLFWASPLVHLYARSLRHVHEYTADAAVLQNTEKKQYGHLLIRQTVSANGLILANHFNFSQLKKRIVMMSRNPSKRLSLVKYTLAAPVFLLLVSFLTSPNNAVMKTSATIGNSITATAMTTDISTNSIAEMPIIRQLLPTSDAQNGDLPIACLAVGSPEPLTNGYIKLGVFQNINGLMLKNNAQKLYSISQFTVYKKSREGILSNAILNTTGGAYNEAVEKLVSTAQIGDRYYFHDILVSKKGAENRINLGIMEFFVGEQAQQPPFDVAKYPIPNPSVSMANMGTISRNAFIKQTNLDINQPPYNSPVICAVQSFAVVYKPFGKSASDYQQSNNTASKYAPSTLDLIQKAQNGDVYEFRKIKVRCPGDVAARELFDFAITIGIEGATYQDPSPSARIVRHENGRVDTIMVDKNPNPQKVSARTEMMKYLYNNTKVPKRISEGTIKGCMFVYYNLDENGNYSNVTIQPVFTEPSGKFIDKLDCPECFEECNRILKNMPKDLLISNHKKEEYKDKEGKTMKDWFPVNMPLKKYFND